MKKILVIEDNLEVRENLGEILEISGYQVTLAEDGIEGVDKASQELPDLIICDVMMPRLDGYGVLNILGKKKETACIPFIFLTAKAEKTDIRRGMNLGADDYITKPFYKDDLLSVVETRLAKNERLRHSFDRTENGLFAFINEAKGYEDLKKLAVEKKSKIYKKRAVIYEETDNPRNLYFLKSGQVKIYKGNEDGKELIIEIIGEGQFFGFSDLIQETLYHESAAALEETEVVMIPKNDFLELLHKNRDVTGQMIKILANNITEKEEQLIQLAYNSVRKRVADALLLLHQKNNGDAIQILRDDLARIVGTAKESVIRMLSEFKDDGYIEISEGGIKILNVKKLETMPG